MSNPTDPAVDRATLARELRAAVDAKTKPLGALGALEELAIRIGLVQGTRTPTLAHPALVVFAGDHGLARAGVSAYPPEVTAQMVLNFVRGGAAINVFCRQHGIALHVVDAGVATDFPPDTPIQHRKVGHGTRDARHGDALTAEELDRCLAHGRAVVDDLHAGGCNVLGLGEMGIGNTSAATLVMSAALDLPVAACTGRGTGVDDAGLAHKRAVLTEARARHPETTGDPLAALRAFGGYEMAQLAGAMAAADARGMVVLVDGFIATSALLAAEALRPGLRERAVFAHLSDEAAHAQLLDHLGAEPLLRLGLQLGEGTGCALAYPLLVSAVAFLHEMASFADAGVSERATTT